MTHEWMGEWLSWGWPLLINHLWQAALFSALVLVVSRLLRRGPARARYALWLVASLKFVLPSALLLFLARQSGLDPAALQTSFMRSTEQSPAAASVVSPLSHLSGTSIIESVQQSNNLFFALTALWLIGFTLLVALWHRRRKQFSQAIKGGVLTTTGREFDALQRAQRRLGSAREIKLVISPLLIEPGVCGTWKPVMLMPAGIAEHLSDDELEAVALHEVAHVGRWDNVVGNLQMLLCCFLWFHPVVWLINRKLLVERERACDEQVIKVSGGSKTYISGILKVCRFCLGWKVAGVSGMAGANLRERIAQITSQKIDERLRLSHRLALCLTAATLIIFSVASAELGHNNVNARSQAQAQPSGTPAGSASSENENSAPARDSQQNGVSPQESRTDSSGATAASQEDKSSRSETAQRENSARVAGRDEIVEPRNASQPDAAAKARERNARPPAQDDEQELSEAEINEIKRRAAQEHPEDADDANIVVVVNKNKQVVNNSSTVELNSTKP